MSGNGPFFGCYSARTNVFIYQKIMSELWNGIIINFEILVSRLHKNIRNLPKHFISRYGITVHMGCDNLTVLLRRDFPSPQKKTYSYRTWCYTLFCLHFVRIVFHFINRTKNINNEIFIFQLEWWGALGIDRLDNLNLLSLFKQL